MAIFGGGAIAATDGFAVSAGGGGTFSTTGLGVENALAPPKLGLPLAGRLAGSTEALVRNGAHQSARGVRPCALASRIPRENWLFDST